VLFNNVCYSTLLDLLQKTAHFQHFTCLVEIFMFTAAFLLIALKALKVVDEPVENNQWFL